jgi:hypothetical protein
MVRVADCDSAHPGSIPGAHPKRLSKPFFTRKMVELPETPAMVTDLVTGTQV